MVLVRCTCLVDSIIWDNFEFSGLVYFILILKSWPLSVSCTACACCCLIKSSSCSFSSASCSRPLVVHVAIITLTLELEFLNWGGAWLQYATPTALPDHTPYEPQWHGCWESQESENLGARKHRCALKTHKETILDLFNQLSFFFLPLSLFFYWQVLEKQVWFTWFATARCLATPAGLWAVMWRSRYIDLLVFANLWIILYISAHDHFPVVAHADPWLREGTLFFDQLFPWVLGRRRLTITQERTTGLLPKCQW